MTNTNKQYMDECEAKMVTLFDEAVNRANERDSIPTVIVTIPANQTRAERLTSLVRYIFGRPNA